MCCDIHVPNQVFSIVLWEGPPFVIGQRSGFFFIPVLQGQLVGAGTIERLLPKLVRFPL
jgi:hypothetical protein